MIRKLVFSTEARSKIWQGVEKLANTVTCTLGPKGRNVIIDKGDFPPLVTNDGVTIAKEVKVEDRLEQMGVHLVKQAAEKTNDAAGDGTTTAVLLASELIRLGLKHIEDGVNPMRLRIGMDKAVERINTELLDLATPVKDKETLRFVAKMSTGSGKLGDIIAEVIDKVGVDGAVALEEKMDLGIEHELVEGYQFDKGYISPYLYTDAERMEIVLEDAVVLLFSEPINNAGALAQKIMQPLVEQGVKSVLIVADNYEQPVIQTLVHNHRNGTIQIAATYSDLWGRQRKEWLDDLAAITGATVIGTEAGLDLMRSKPEELLGSVGRIHKVIMTEEKTILLIGDEAEERKEAMALRAETLRNQIPREKNDFTRENVQKRLAKLEGGVGVIRVGAPTEAELGELKLRLEDGIEAAKAALSEGIVPGGGRALYYLALQPTPDLDSRDEQVGYDMVYTAGTAVLRKVIENAGKNPDEVIGSLVDRDVNYGYDAWEDKNCDLIEQGVIDPVKVVRSSIQNAVSVAASLLTTEAVVAEGEKPRDITA